MILLEAENIAEREVLLEVQNLKKHYSVGGESFFSGSKEKVLAVDGVDLLIYKGETFGLVGESGCGKTTLGKCIAALEKPTNGSVIFENCNLFELRRQELRRLRREIQIILQDPYDSLDPRMRIGDIIAEPLLANHVGGRIYREKQVAYLLEIVGLSASHAGRYPHEFSGGQRQRIGIARALALNPKLIVCDEPVSALDVSIQSQIINLLCDLRKEFNLTYFFISHGLAVVKHIADRVAVMYLGKIVEFANKNEIFDHPRHPYTEVLISAIPVPDPRYHRNRILLEGDVPSPIRPPAGCRFHTRCLKVREICKQEDPTLVDIGEHHWVACHLMSNN